MKRFYFFRYLLCLWMGAGCLLSAAQVYAPNGGPFTPRGDLRILIVFAGFTSDCNDFAGSIWPNVNPAQGMDSCKTFPVYYKDLFYSDFNQFGPEAQDHSISNFYYQMSRHHPENPPLRIVADIFPERINIPGRNQNTKEVFKEIQKRYPNFDWSRYDNRKNFPDFKSDNSGYAPDHIIDYIVVIYGVPGGSGYASTISFTFTTSVKGHAEEYKTEGACGFTITHGLTANTYTLVSIFHHELAHTLFNCPHLFYTNNVTGDYFYASTGWGLMNYGSVLSTANAWECWYNGWTELPEDRDLTSYSQNGKYTLRDFVTTGDAMRIKLPHSNQRLWIENHTGASKLDERDAFNTDGMGDPIPPVNMGLFMYVENLTDSRSMLLSPLSSLYANGLKVMHAGGNYDYKALSDTIEGRYWKNRVVDFTVVAPNPAGAHNDAAWIRENYQYDTLYPDKIVYRKFTNNPQEYCALCKEPCKVKVGQEAMNVLKKDGQWTFDHLGTHMAFGNGKLPQKTGISYNPMIINHQKYICPDKLEPIHLHGVSVSVLSKAANGDITIEVKFDDTEIVRDQRFTGELILHDVPNANYDLWIRRGNTLTLDKSGTPNRYDRGRLIDGAYAFPDFINPSLLVFEKGTQVLIEEDASLLVQNGSSLWIKEGATLILRGILKISGDGFLKVDPGAIIQNEGGKIRKKKTAGSLINPLLKL